jgi:glutathione synthase
MSHRFLYVMDPLEGVDPFADTTFDFLLENQSRGVENVICTIHDLRTDRDKGFARGRQVSVRRPTDDDPTTVTWGDDVDTAFDDCHAIFMRKDPPVDLTFLHATMLLDRHDPSKTLMVNEPASLRVANEKLFGLFAAELFPRTVVTADREALKATVVEMGKAVLKPLDAAGGGGVMVFDKDDKNLNSAIDLLTDEGRRPAIAQAYEKDVVKGDKRVILLGGEPIGAVLRVPHASDHRANMHVGGSVAQSDVDDDDRRISARLKPMLVELGLHFVGIDVIGGKLTEVNVTSPTGVQEIDRLDGRTGKNRMSAQVMDYVFERLPRQG